jgi:hypothetical protein
MDPIMALEQEILLTHSSSAFARVVLTAELIRTSGLLLTTLA